MEHRHGREGARCTEIVISAVMDEGPGYNERHVTIERYGPGRC